MSVSPPAERERATQVEVTCYRCYQPIIHSNHRVADQLAKDYPGQDICCYCDLDLIMEGQVERAAILKPKLHRLQSLLGAIND